MTTATLTITDMVNRVTTIINVPDWAQGFFSNAIVNAPDPAIEARSITPLLAQLEERITPLQTANETASQEEWALCGLALRQLGRTHQGIHVFLSLYRHMVKGQAERSQWVHKAMPLVWISDCLKDAGLNHLAQRYLVLTTIEDAQVDLNNAQNNNKLSRTAGVFFRAVWSGWFGEDEIDELARKAHTEFNRLGEDAWYPERVLQEVEPRWMRHHPTDSEVSRWMANLGYVEHLRGRFGPTDAGRSLELCAHYLLSCVPGWRARRRVPSQVSEYDVFGTIEGPVNDFRSEAGRIFVAECKDWVDPAGFTVVAKFSRVLDSVGARFGILFSKEGITGERRHNAAWLEIVKLYQQRGIVISVITLSDIEDIIAGHDFIAMLREKYEAVRFNL